MGVGRHLGKLAAMVNPLDQSAVQQIIKSSGGSKFAQALNLVRAGGKQIASGGYFSGKNLNYANGRFRSRTVGNLGKMSANSEGRRIARSVAGGVGQTRQAIGLGLGALIGLNAMAPNSGLTSAANIGAMGIAAYGIGQGPIASKFGQKGANWMYAGLGAGAIGHLTGII